MKLNVGSGFVGDGIFSKGWLNVDFAYEPNDPKWQTAEYKSFDIKGKWPMESEVADCIFASHVLEHIEYGKLMDVLRECYRVLKQGAPIRIIGPDPRKFLENWRAQNKQFILDSYGQQNYDRWDYENNSHIGFTDMFFGDHYDHQVCLSIDVLMIMMVRVGFSEIYDMPYQCTIFPEFFGSGQEGGEPSVDNRPSMSFYVEGVK